MKQILFLLLISFLFIVGCKKIEAPNPIGPTPSKRQLNWHELEYYGFIHFNMNTFTNMEWGTGGESPKSFNPTQLDCNQWAQVAKKAGMKGLIITAKHHDGFCLWPSKYTEHSIKNSPWKNGKGDIIKDLSKACKANGLKFGVYLSPWDRNHAQYAKPEYVTYFQNQLRELLSNYGPLFEVWFDGANGGSGYYGGANETRKITEAYYKWDETTAIVRKLQPEAVIFGSPNRDVRWVGNEQGYGHPTNWSTFSPDEKGWTKTRAESGLENGLKWTPAECDVSIRPGWYYHPSEDTEVKSLEKLVDIYYSSIGRNASFLLNLPVDNRGLVHENDIKQLMKLKAQIEKDFKHDLSKNAKITASNTRGNAKRFNTNKLTDNNNLTYWATDDNIKKASLTFNFKKPTTINRVLLMEHIALGQRIKSFTIEAKTNNQWKRIDSQTTVGYKRILRFNSITAKTFKINIDAKASITLSKVAFFKAPTILTQPKISRNKNGLLSIQVPNQNTEIYYTLDESTPSPNSLKYNTPILINKPTTIKAINYNPENQEQTAITKQFFDIAKKNWKVIAPKKPKESIISIIDDNPSTVWTSTQKSKTPTEVVIDLGISHHLTGFYYTPQLKHPIGAITSYEFYVSENGKSWKKISQGEFANIQHNPVQQNVYFKSTTGKYIKLKALKIAGNSKISISEIGVFTKKQHH